ncbi:hypothetical protein [Nocardioides rubriscoriae]|uniref:hypothetical protein n=1 Tax=Nocardioides rubriscoriae TaxID=642762 RepID=UPI0011DFAED8|nr:hypothetical protein [Nocardioides rubriscoriae]
MRSRPLLALALVGALATGCSEEAAPEIVRPPEVVRPAPVYDPDLEPAAAVMAVVPAEATVLEVTDFDQVRLSLGFGELTSASDKGVRARFWRRADQRSPLLSRGMLRDQGYQQRFGFTQDDVSWEAHFTGPAIEGYVVKFRDDLDMSGVARAAQAADGPLAGATVVAAAHVAAVGATREPTESWAAEPELVDLVGQTSLSTYVARDCLRVEEAFGRDVTGELAPSPAADLAGLDALGAFSVGFGGTVVSVRLGPARDDVFDRARLAERLPATDPDFGTGFTDPVADPVGGRIGFQLGDGPVAAALAHERQLPFAVCGG